MFDNFKNMAGLAGMLKDLPKMKAKMEEVKQRLETSEVAAETGGGAVRVRASGALRILSVTIDPAMLSVLVDADNPDDRGMAEDLVVGAVNAALAKARDLAEQEMAAAAGELGLPIPPGALGGLMS